MNSLITHHLLLCVTPSSSRCCDPSIGKESWLRLKKIISELGLESQRNKSGIILRSKVDCLRICKEGPILLIWPDGIWYKKVTSEKIDKIIDEHIINGNPLEEWILKRTPFSISKKYST